MCARLEKECSHHLAAADQDVIEDHSRHLADQDDFKSIAIIVQTSVVIDIKGQCQYQPMAIAHCTYLTLRQSSVAFQQVRLWLSSFVEINKNYNYAQTCSVMADLLMPLIFL